MGKEKSRNDYSSIFPAPDLPQADPVTANLDVGGMTQDLQVLCTSGGFQIGSYVTAYLDSDDVHGVPYVVTEDNQHWEFFPPTIPRELIGNGSNCVYYKWSKPDSHGNPPVSSYPEPINAYNAPYNPQGLTLVISSVTDDQPPDGSSNDMAGVMVLQGNDFYPERVQLTLVGDGAQFVPDGGQAMTVKTGARVVQVGFTSTQAGTVTLWGNLIDHPEVQDHRDFTFGGGEIAVKVDFRANRVAPDGRSANEVVLALEYVDGGSVHKIARIDVSVQTSDGLDTENVLIYRDRALQHPCTYVFTGDQGKATAYLAKNPDSVDAAGQYKLVATPRLESAAKNVVPFVFEKPMGY